MSKRVLVKNAKIIGRFCNYPRNYIIQDLDNVDMFYDIEVNKSKRGVGAVGKIMYNTGFREGYYTFE